MSEFELRGWVDGVYGPPAWSRRARDGGLSCLPKHLDSVLAVRSFESRSPAGPRRLRLFADPACMVNQSTTGHTEFWRLVRTTPQIDWLMPIGLRDGGALSLPLDWGSGYENVWFGVQLRTPSDAKHQLRALRAAPARHRFVVVGVLLSDLGDLDLRDVEWLVLPRLAQTFSEEWASSVKLQCMAYGVPCWEENDRQGPRRAARVASQNHFLVDAD
jgi:hypothetical protein